jgi:UDP-N-acetylmuramoyl-L-alanyl-D-glutamate--2,6-diaminopimelate ligase
MPLGKDAPVMTFPAHSASTPVSLRRLFPDASFVGRAEIAVADATDRSGEVRPGCLFAALAGTNVHGRTFVADAIARGATAILTDAPLADARVPQCIVRDVRTAYGQLCHTLEQWPSRRMGVVGVTGTNGKTTVTWLVRSILARHGLGCGLSGTIETSDGRRSTPSSLTTPDPRSLSRWLAATRASGCDFATLEVSSHALDQDRTAGLELDAAIVTNITRDHLDYHPTLDAYRAAKSRLALLLKRGGRWILNADDPASAALAAQTPVLAQCLTFGIDQPADVQAVGIRQSATGSRFDLRIGPENIPIETSLPGRFNISNCLAAAAAAWHLGAAPEEIAAGIADTALVPGRMQRVDCGQRFAVLVDYAHTDDALTHVIEAARQTTRGRVTVVFGAGGERDRGKRSAMGMAAARADQVVVTSDNPRTEDPQAIIYDILAGCVSSRVHIDPDRTRAIEWALDQAEPGDCVLLCGKGHEKIQIIGRERIPFDDAAVAAQFLSSRFTLVQAPHLSLSRQPA